MGLLEWCVVFTYFWNRSFDVSTYPLVRLELEPGMWNLPLRLPCPIGIIMILSHPWNASNAKWFSYISFYFGGIPPLLRSIWYIPLFLSYVRVLSLLCLVCFLFRIGYSTNSPSATSLIRNYIDCYQIVANCTSTKPSIVCLIYTGRKTLPILTLVSSTPYDIFNGPRIRLLIGVEDQTPSLNFPGRSGKVMWVIIIRMLIMSINHNEQLAYCSPEMILKWNAKQSQSIW